MTKLRNINGSPFARLSAEEEKNYLKEIYYKQQYYDALVDVAEASASRFILGQRGQGKSATMLHLLEDMRSLHLLPILIDQYDEFPISNNKNYFIHAMIYRLTFELAECLMKDKSLAKKLNSTQNQKLGLYIEMFYDPITASHCIESAKNIASKKRRNKIKAFFNKHIPFINNLFGLTLEIGVDLILTLAGLEKSEKINSNRELFHELEIESYAQISRDTIVSWESSKLKQILYNLRDIACTIGYHSIVIMFDKIDEIASINGQTERVTTFLTDLLSDTNLLYTDNIAIVVSLWSEVRRLLSKQGIRFDKFKEVDIRWENEDLVKLLNKRLKYFAKVKETSPTFESLIPDKNDEATVLALADKSPRSLLNLLGTILDQERAEEFIDRFSPDALSKGYIKYCKTFDYASAQPTRTGKGSDVVIWIEKLLQMKLTQFSRENYGTCFNITQKTVSRNIDTLLKYNLIKESVMPTEDGEPMYEVADPRIKFLISRGVLSLNQ